MTDRCKNKFSTQQFFVFTLSLVLIFFQCEILFGAQPQKKLNPKTRSLSPRARTSTPPRSATPAAKPAPTPSAPRSDRLPPSVESTPVKIPPSSTSQIPTNISEKPSSEKSNLTTTNPPSSGTSNSGSGSEPQNSPAPSVNFSAPANQSPAPGFPQSQPPTPRPPPPKNTSSWKFDSKMEWINGVIAREVARHPINPSNRVLGVERGFGETDLRLDFRLKHDYFRLVVRPRLEVTSGEIFYEDTRTTSRNNQTLYNLTEGFTEFWLGSHVTVGVGLQNFQWGPAEVISPSNPFYHFDRTQRSVFWREKGHILSRLNLSATDSWSFIVMNEFADRGDPFWIAERKFEPKSLVKLEYRSSDNSTNALGLVYGEEEAKRKFFGEYFAIALGDSFSFYGDARHTQGDISYKPQAVTSTIDLMQTNANLSQQMIHLAVMGFRFEGAVDLRLEGIYNSAGYDQTTLAAALNSCLPTNPYSLLNLSRFARPGLELPQQKYVYMSLRWDDFLSFKETTFYLRSLNGLQPFSGVVTGSFDIPLNDFFVLTTEASATHGPPESEFALFEKSSFGVAVKVAY